MPFESTERILSVPANLIAHKLECGPGGGASRCTQCDSGAEKNGKKAGSPKAAFLVPVEVAVDRDVSVLLDKTIFCE